MQGSSALIKLQLPGIPLLVRATINVWGAVLIMSHRTSSYSCTMGYSVYSLHPSLPFSEQKLNDLSVQYDPPVQPALLRSEIQATPLSHATIASARFAAARIIAGQDDRVLVIVGPCSIHSPEQALAYARLLKDKLSSWPNLHIIMRSYLCVSLSH